jgi:hypothetical protein
MQLPLGCLTKLLLHICNTIQGSCTTPSDNYWIGCRWYASYVQTAGRTAGLLCRPVCRVVNLQTDDIERTVDKAPFRLYGV